MLDKIKKLCDEKNMSIASLEREAGLGRGSIWRWDKNAPSIEKAQKVADYFGVSLDYLIGRTDNPLLYVDPTDEERQMVDIYRKAKASDKESVRLMVEAIDKVLRE